MNIEQSFLMDILAQPGDDFPRLVYADWLDDHGKEERGEFIRLQCELADVGNHFVPGSPVRKSSCACALEALRDDEREIALRCRERELFSRFDTTGWWRDKFQSAVAYPSSAERKQFSVNAHIGYRRGFVESLQVSNKAWLMRFGPEAAANHPLSTIEILGWLPRREEYVNIQGVVGPSSWFWPEPLFILADNYPEIPLHRRLSFHDALFAATDHKQYTTWEDALSCMRRLLVGWSRQQAAEEGILPG